MTVFTPKTIVLLQLWADYFWEQYLRARQYHKVVAVTEPPPDLAAILPPKTFAENKANTLARKRFDFVQDLLRILISTTIICCDFLPFLWVFFDSYGLDEVTHGCLWYVTLNLVTSLVRFPLTLYGIFVVEKEKSGILAWEKLTTFVWSQIFSVVISGFLVGVIQQGEVVLMGAWMVLCGTVFVVGFVYPRLSPSKFRNLEILENGTLRKSIKDLAGLVQLPLDEIYVEERLKRSSRNAIYFYGFSSKSVVLSDFLLEDKSLSNEEIVALLALEINKWYRNHNLKYLLALETNLILSFSVFWFCFNNEDIYHGFGFRTTKPILVGVYIVIKYVMVLYSTIASTVFVHASRQLVFESDGFAASLGKSVSLIRGLVRLERNSVAFPVYDGWYSGWYHDRPTLMERIREIRSAKFK